MDKYCPDETPGWIWDMIIGISGDLLVRGFNSAALTVSRYAPRNGPTDSEWRFAPLVNEWLARKALQSDVDDVLSEVRAWHPEGEVYKLAKLCLLGEHAEAAAMARELVSSDVLPVSAIRGWPLFDELRVLHLVDWTNDMNVEG